MKGDKEYYPFDEVEPDFVNADGVKWWKRNLLTRRLLDGGVRAVCYNVELANGKRNIVLLDDKGVFFETQSLEAISSRIDMEIYLANHK